MPTGGRGEYTDGVREARFIYRDIIRAAIEKKFGSKSNGADGPIVPVMLQIDEVSPGAITHDMIRNIAKSDLVIVDITGANPNVFYETGIAHTLCKHVIPITQSSSDVPFDLRHHRYIRYHNNGEGRVKLQQDLQRRLARLCEL